LIVTRLCPDALAPFAAEPLPVVGLFAAMVPPFCV
jgi:hypothetical protein